MRLTSYTTYSLRILMYCSLHRDRLVTIPEVAAACDISRAHLLKVGATPQPAGLPANGAGAQRRYCAHPMTGGIKRHDH